MDPRKILAALADLAPARSDLILDVARAGQPFAWLDDPDRAPRGRVGDRFAGLDALHREERVLRRGWGWVLGSTEIGGVQRRVRQPLVSQPVRIERGLRARLLPAGDMEITPLVADRALATRFEEASGLGAAGWLTAPGTKAWISSLAWAADLPVRDVLAPPVKKAPAGHLVAYAAAALYIARDVASTGPRDTLLTWANQSGLEQTALAAVYTGAAAEQPDDPHVTSPLPLNAAQREVVARTRRERVVVVSGPPGSGKSHAVVAAALDTVDRGGSVLIATQSRHAADVLGGLLERYPGPVPVLFGDAERRDEIATTLTSGLGEGVSRRQLADDAQAARAAVEAVRAIERRITAALEKEALAEELEDWLPLLSSLRADVPAAFAPDFDLDEARRLRDAATRDADGLWHRWKRSRAERHLHRRLQAGTHTPPAGDRVDRALRAAASLRASSELASTGGTDLAADWAALIRADDEVAAATGTLMRHRATSAERWDAAARRSAAALAAALRAGRNRRRESLAALDAPALVRALPLWVGTVTDAEELLPAVPGLFDLVILDEAAHIDQIRAAPVLARARRALVVGDPRQLRFVSFVGDADVAVTLGKHRLSEYADRLDIRRISAFDLAAGSAAVTLLDEHYRSVPHLIEFSARRFYDDRIALVTRHPRTEDTDAVELRRVTPETEIDAVLAEIRGLPAGTTGIGVITPFRPHADALEAALLSAFTVPEIEAMNLRVGTVHAFQGAEADVVIASLALSDTDPPARHRFATDPNLFNVLITRARHRLIVVTALGRPTGLLGDFLTYADSPPRPAHAPPDAAKGWPAHLGRELAESGIPVRADYPVGRWTVDLCAADTGLICRVHPLGPEAHIERQRTLLRAGWHLHDAFPTRWNADATRAALDLAP
ncbi:AAA domain-containing protein [Catenuloplanes sp. NPDC051500]|uniref:AAA domain-containing protein n=1 Tax=Catenuloplanes sp. NPDC051500 TaxID=3363959 RepID=UPI0037AA3C7B